MVLRKILPIAMAPPSKAAIDKIFEGKYPAKAHFKRVLSYLRTTDAAAVSSGGVIFVESAKSQLWPNSDQEQPFRQSRSFYYLTGCDLPDCAVLYFVKSERSVLFIPPVNEAEVIWSGLPLSKEEAVEKYDVDEVQTSDTLQAHFQKADLTHKSTVWTVTSDPFSTHSLSSYGASNSLTLKDAIEEARVVKDDYEIALTRKANEVTDAAHRAVLSAASTARNERELQATFVQSCTSAGCPNQAYSPIVASGTDAATLHYVRNNKGINDRTLNLLLDAGAEYDCYASDVTRTFPINGKFTEESANIYRLVLRMQTECMSRLKAGVKWDEIHALAHKIAIEGLLELGILKGEPADIGAAKTSTGFFPHGLGHYLGMDTHDTGGHPNYGDQDPMFKYLRVRGALPAGSIVTVEPGIYFCKFILDPMLKDEKHKGFIDEQVLERYWTVGGVRIEDDVLITHEGFENLTMVPRQLEEVGSLMAR
ncbi:MAG: hypothetical protein M1828_004723 [Chrysothrix sp. TS-e1954]|nr:MAG: hypothetical protein M1828_004723 [Chrysothrix sp. TS-e1954]